MQVMFETFGRADGVLSIKKLHSRLKSTAVVDTDCEEDDSESIWTERQCDLSKEDEGEALISDDCDKHDNDNNCDGDCVIVVIIICAMLR